MNEQWARDSDRYCCDSTRQSGEKMRLDTVDYRSTQSDVRTSTDHSSRKTLLTPERKAALEALEREFRDLLKSSQS